MALPQRKHIRLKDYDYSQNGAYFVTICLKPHLPILGNIVGAGPRPARMDLSPLGEIVLNTWVDLPNHNPNIVLGPFVVMPDHIHGIIVLDGRAGLGPAPTALPELIRQLKSFSARRINELRQTPGTPLWQRGYYEHILRSPQDFDEAATYIRDNPARWCARLKGESL